MAKRVKMPEEVDMVSSRDICKRSMFEGEKCCLLGLVHNNFSWTAYNSVSKEIKKVISSELKIPWLAFHTKEPPYLGITDFNDSPKTSKSLIARVWNRTMYRLGYTEGNPESKSLKGAK